MTTYPGYGGSAGILFVAPQPQTLAGKSRQVTEEIHLQSHNETSQVGVLKSCRLWYANVPDWAHLGWIHQLGVTTWSLGTLADELYFRRNLAAQSSSSPNLKLTD